MTGLRERKKAETRRRIQQHALHLFRTKGYEATTVEEIAAAAGVSHMTFFRYFPSKHAVVENDDYDPVIAELIRSRPASEDPLTAIRRALAGALRAMPDAELATVLARARLILGEPALRARQIESQRTTRELFAAAIADRGDAPPAFERQVLAAAALSTLAVAIDEWAAHDGAENLADLVDRAFAALSAVRPG
ncbi:TetR family transcriptional regulator [Actinoplanes sp. NPDC049548]|uniref:acyl-CoA-like ligand-binding transcription factor n=1 Tax=Actinoplanes sp. NPDC049548 TaxID=3155152 RepID=UPI0034396168